MSEVNFIETNEPEEFSDESRFYLVSYDDEEGVIACVPAMAEWLNHMLNDFKTMWVRAGRAAGSLKSPKKARASRVNGKKGGRPVTVRRKNK